MFTNKSSLINQNNYFIYQNYVKNFFGAYFDEEGNCTFKLLTFADCDNVVLEVKRKGLPVSKFNMLKSDICVWQITLDNIQIQSGDRYRFVITRKNQTFCVKDPCSMWQDSYFKWSIAYNHNLFEWNDNKWINALEKRRISRLANDNNILSSVDELRIYELHTGTFTKEGTFESAKKALDKIAGELKFNAIEIMPVENTYSFNWGYDGVDKYAPNHTYGTPDDLKSFIDYAHKLGLNVIMDFVPNHFGPDIAELQNTGPYSEGTNCFGYKFNFEHDEYSKYVRDFIIGAALNWLINYHCDGLRADMTKFMCSDYTMKQMVAEINYYIPNAFLIAEDGRDNDIRVTKPFTQTEIDENEYKHSKFIKKIKNNNISLTNLGFDTEWDFPYHKQIVSSLLGYWDCRIKNLADFDVSLKTAQTRVKYPMSHDEIGNVDGTRLITKLFADRLKLTDCICGCTNSDKCKKSAHTAQKILVALLAGELEKMTEEESKSFYGSLDLNINYPFETVYNTFIESVKLHKLAIGKTYSIPGPKMIFQGDESGDISYFKFFRKFSIGQEPYLNDKGYKPGLPAFLDSKLKSVYVDEKYAHINLEIENFMKDLNILCEDNIALTIGHIEKTFAHNNSDIHAIHCKKIYNEVFSVSNFTGINYLNNYGILFPKGEWKEIFNSDKKEYGGEEKYLNGNLSKEPYKYISIPAYGIMFFEKIQ